MQALTRLVSAESALVEQIRSATVAVDAVGTANLDASLNTLAGAVRAAQMRLAIRLAEFESLLAGATLVYREAAEEIAADVQSVRKIPWPDVPGCPEDFVPPATPLPAPLASAEVKVEAEAESEPDRTLEWPTRVIITDDRNGAELVGQSTDGGAALDDHMKLVLDADYKVNRAVDHMTKLTAPAGNGKAKRRKK